MDKQHAQDKVKQFRASATIRMDSLNEDEIAYFEGVEEKLYGKLKERNDIRRERMKRHTKAVIAENARGTSRWESEGGHVKGA